MNNTIQTTEYICINCQDPIIHHSHYHDKRFCEECRTNITDRFDSNKGTEYANQFVNSDDFLNAVYEEIIHPKHYEIDERF